LKSLFAVSLADRISGKCHKRRISDKIDWASHALASCTEVHIIILFKLLIPAAEDRRSAAMAVVLHYWWLFAIPLAFIAIVVFVFLPSRKRKFDADAQIPFRDKNGSRRK
jgi:cbb3-type cytochrome oxidase subunit 3